MQTTEKTYEMMWDCQYCGQAKLLGLTHRHCPGCGAPQDASRRYFPPDHEKVAVQDHQFVGGDLLCPSCRQAMSRRCVHCTFCGSPMAGGKDVGLKQDLPRWPPGQAPGQAPAAKKKSKAPWIISLVILAVICLVTLRACVKKDVTVTVTHHGWSREITVERFEEVEKKGACSSVPRDARVKSRRKGEPVCTQKKIDNGDGTFKEKQVCSEPVEQCTYAVSEWHEARTAKISGGPEQAPAWPATGITRTGECQGCEREGARTELYTVYFENDATKKELSCDLNSATRWKSYEVGAKYRAKIFVIGGGLDCGSLEKK